MRIQTDPRIGDVTNPSFKTRFYEIWAALARQLNGISEGSIQAVTNASTAAPTAGTYQQGDKVMNSTPTEAGAPGSKYVVTGWVCTVAGTPGTWLEMRTLTGN